MTNIKKQYQEIYALLASNKNKKVSTIMDQLEELMSKKSAGGVDGKTFIKDDDGNVVAIFCYYHKKWELLEECEYGLKASSSTGYNTMCKEGVREWNAQQKEIKALDGHLINEVASGELAVENIEAVKQARIAEIKSNIVPRSDGLGYDEAPIATTSHFDE